MGLQVAKFSNIFALQSLHDHLPDCFSPYGLPTGRQDVDYLNMHAEKHGRRATLSVLEGMAYRGPCLYALKWGQAEKLKEELCAGL